MSKLRCTRLLRMSPDWIKFDTQLIISVQLLIRKRKVEKFSCVFKKKNEAINETSLAGYETIIFQVSVYTVSRPWAKLFNYINIKDFSYHKKGQHSPTLAVWLFVLSKFDERAVPVSFSASEMSFCGTEQEELAIIPFFYRPCNVQSTVQGMRSMFTMYTFCDLHSHSMFAVPVADQDK